jgi:hypothetical protein
MISYVKQSLEYRATLVHVNTFVSALIGAFLQVCPIIAPRLPSFVFPIGTGPEWEKQA